MDGDDNKIAVEIARIEQNIKDIRYDIAEIRQSLKEINEVLYNGKEGGLVTEIMFLKRMREENEKTTMKIIALAGVIASVVSIIVGIIFKVGL
jgi:hypothetical protein